jgi:hypothetical protein
LNALRTVGSCPLPFANSSLDRPLTANRSPHAVRTVNGMATTKEAMTTTKDTPTSLAAATGRKRAANGAEHDGTALLDLLDQAVLASVGLASQALELGRSASAELARLVETTIATSADTAETIGAFAGPLEPVFTQSVEGVRRVADATTNAARAVLVG